VATFHLPLGCETCECDLASWQSHPPSVLVPWLLGSTVKHVNEILLLGRGTSGPYLASCNSLPHFLGNLFAWACMHFIHATKISDALWQAHGIYCRNV
jgi:hypothetical protein